MKRRNKYSLSHHRILTGDMGEILPIGIQPVLPGDSFQHQAQLLLRVSPLLAPVMHPVKVKIQHHFVPYRLLWDESEDFFTGGEDGLSAPTLPTMAFTAAGSGQAAVGSLADYLGVPTGVDVTVSALPFRAMVQIYNDHKRNTLLQPALAMSRASGVDTTTVRALQNCNWGHDRFTGAHPDPQLGPDVTVPLLDSAPVISNDELILMKTSGGSDRQVRIENDGGLNHASFSGAAAGSVTPMQFGSESGLLADLAAATGISMHQLANSAALQRFMTNRMIHGSRYSDLLSQWGVRYSDARLQRAEYLGGGVQTIQFSEVLQTGVTTDADIDGVGNLRGHGIARAKSNAYRKTFEEHGYVISTLEVLPDTMYVQGVPREYIKSAKTDFYTPEFVNVGEQEIQNREVYAAAADPDGVWGYEPRYREYREGISTVHGEFRSTLDFWHYGRLFASEPALNSSFITANPTKRVNQVTSADVLWLFVNHSIQARRIVSRNTQFSIG